MSLSLNVLFLLVACVDETARNGLVVSLICGGECRLILPIPDVFRLEDDFFD